MEKRYFVFRTDDSRKDWIFKELQAGRLRQGWGISGTRLVEKHDPVPKSVWTKRYIEAARRIWGVKSSREEGEQRYGILLPMTEMSKGSLVVIPKMPDWDSFVLARVDSGYSFDASTRGSKVNGDDFRHVIGVDKNFRIFDYSSSVEAKTIKAMLRGYQAAVNNVWDQRFLQAVDTLSRKRSYRTVSKARETPRLLSEIQERIIEKSLSTLAAFPPSDFEDLVRRVFENAGFQVTKAHHFDKYGGDADLELTMPIPLISDYADDYSQKVYVQVKKKSGTDYNDAAGVNQLIKISRGDKNAMRILVSLAEDFTDRCKAKASEHNVILIPGRVFLRMALKSIWGQSLTCA